LQGAGIRFLVEGGDGSALPPNAQLEVYTTRPDTVRQSVLSDDMEHVSHGTAATLEAGDSVNIGSGSGSNSVGSGGGGGGGSSSSSSSKHWATSPW